MLKLSAPNVYLIRNNEALIVAFYRITWVKLFQLHISPSFFFWIFFIFPNFFSEPKKARTHCTAITYSLHRIKFNSRQQNYLHLKSLFLFFPVQINFLLFPRKPIFTFPAIDSDTTIHFHIVFHFYYTLKRSILYDTMSCPDIGQHFHCITENWRREKNKKQKISNAKMLNTNFQ